VYVSVAVVLAAAAEGGVKKRRMDLLRELLGCQLDRGTVETWVAWWRETLPSTRLWRQVRARLRWPVDLQRMPLSLLEAFEGKGPEEAVIHLLRLLAPTSLGRAF
jgi:hypothetical protein